MHRLLSRMVAKTSGPRRAEPARARGEVSTWRPPAQPKRCLNEAAHKLRH
jgi:hypothetical protein